LDAGHDPLVQRGIAWLVRNQNPDGGWGDTTLSRSNISTTSLCWAAFAAARADCLHQSTVRRTEEWLCDKAGSLDPDHLARAITRRYGKDRTFSVPILTMLAISGRLGPGRDAWRHVIQLPFELAAAPARWYQWLSLPVVSYALPALIAIGQVRHHRRPGRNPLTRTLRSLSREPTLKLLGKIQPSTGGYLEATPLTSFVTMSLLAAGIPESPVVAEGVRFLVNSARADGSWPIDTNLATWATTLSVNALAAVPAFTLPPEEARPVRDWLLGQQYRTEHPYTHAAPGGWAWTDLPGGVPDADDTPGALIALRNLGPSDDRSRDAARAGLRWLANLQNHDGGIPTFCRGWTNLPFDRSSPDLTAHTLHAWSLWAPELGMEWELQPAIDRALAYLSRAQRKDGSWVPLWFGNQDEPAEENPTYGTARVVIALSKLSHPAALSGARWLTRAQNPDGGWGGGPGIPSSIEETSLALHALGSLTGSGDRESIERGAAWLDQATSTGDRTPPSPIGFYFAKLWYYEDLYPLIFATAGLGMATRYVSR
jgi:squalene-hopene/tetraprenyl-beta-curcumene cyclase